ncbi:MAG: hypothetical protein WC663_05045 [Patescibacteria group bacterium]|jgi:hypothetical protein
MEGQQIGKKNWIKVNSGWTTLSVFCLLTGLGILSNLLFEFCGNVFLACLATYGLVICVIWWFAGLGSFVMIGKKTWSRALFALVAIVVWGGVGIVVYYIWKDLFWAIFSVPIAYCFIALYVDSIANASKEQLQWG